MNQILIRLATDLDGDAVAGLMESAFAEYEGCLFDRALEFPELDAIASHFAARGGMIWVAELNGAVAGSLALSPTNDADAPTGTLEISKVYVDSAARRRGIARALYETARTEAERRAAPEIRLWTDTRFLDAHRFYESCGFIRHEGTRLLHDISDTSEYPYRLPLASPAVAPHHES